VEGLVDGIWLNQGQVCCAGSRLLMQESVAEKLIGKVRARMETLRVGPPLDKAIDVGAIVARVQLDRIRRLVDQGVAEGAVCWQPATAMPSRGLYFPPTLLSNVHPASVVAQEEIFRAGSRGNDFPHAERSRGTGEQYRLWAGGERLEREHQCVTSCVVSTEGGRGLGEQHEFI
jgi:hypothetical protein